MKILFICHGNICRSTMAQMIAEKYNKGLNLNLIIDSAAVSFEEIGNSIYPPAREILKRHNIEILNHYARHFEASEYDYWDAIYYMDSSNRRLLDRIHLDTSNKYHSLLNRDVSDPWYTRDFETCYNDIVEGIEKIVKEIKKN
ncbi:MAG: low molecular weight phosphotyrosine protein phosphatase [Acholeplasmatales bacterium]|nr:low molecular weight phosphotyrosine protein phosphatase [Acholeplasmatales bacterium]